MVDAEDDFASVFSQFRYWVEKEQELIIQSSESDTKSTPKFTFVTCGDWDLQDMLPEQCRKSDIALPPYFTKWINVKHSYQASMAGNYPRSLVAMLEGLDMTFEGRPHSGIDDVKNIVRIVQKLGLEKGHVFQNTGSLEIGQ